MTIPVEVPGLDTIIPELGDGQLVVVESGPDAAKSFFLRRLTLTAGRLGTPVTFVTSRDQGELKKQLAAEGASALGSNGWIRIHERDAIEDLAEFGEGGGLLAVDSFSFLTLNLSSDAFSGMLRAVRAVGRRRGTTVLLATDRGMFDGRSEAIVVHLADGFLQFHAREGAEGVVRFLRIPKWMDGTFVDRNVYYEFDGRRMAIDLRQRVL